MFNDNSPFLEGMPIVVGDDFLWAYKSLKLAFKLLFDFQEFNIDWHVCRSLSVFDSLDWCMASGFGDFESCLGRFFSGKWENTLGLICAYWPIGEPHLFINSIAGNSSFLLLIELFIALAFSSLLIFRSICRCSWIKFFKLLSTFSFILSSSCCFFLKYSISSVSS